MNYYSKAIECSVGTCGEDFFGREHRFFSDYAKSLAMVLAVADWANVLKLSEMILQARNSRGRIFLCGNGGSAANAVHIANDLVYAVAERTGAGIDAISLSTNTAVLTCLGNDVGYENIYSEQLAVSGRAGDVLIVLSGSGNSQNVINAIHTAQKRDMRTVAILGFDGGLCKQLVELPIHFNIDDMQIAEDLQLTVGHMVMKWLKKEIAEFQ
ncbi:MAG: SIS domain-containing protein [Alphaproteobacteria bacterium]|nr:SIS domain-containing protein [Alphaproteobacteria bacterium]